VDAAAGAEAVEDLAAAAAVEDSADSVAEEDLAAAAVAPAGNEDRKD